MSFFSAHGRFDMSHVDMSFWGHPWIMVTRLVYRFPPEQWDGEEDDPRWTTWGLYFFGLEINVHVQYSLERWLRGKKPARYRFGDAPDP